MARSFVRGRSFNQYLRKGFNLVHRIQVGDEPDDQQDLFELVGYSKTRKAAEKKAGKCDFDTEIVEFKLDVGTK